VSRIHAAVGRLASRLKSRAGVSVTYTRRLGASEERQISLVAVVGQHRHENDLNQNQVGRFDYSKRDYLVMAADLVLDGQTFLPQAGDTVIEMVGGVERRFVLMSTVSEGAWRYTDQTETIIRLHTEER
jgi:hypothetical protein